MTGPVLQDRPPTPDELAAAKPIWESLKKAGARPEQIQQAFIQRVSKQFPGVDFYATAPSKDDLNAAAPAIGQPNPQDFTLDGLLQPGQTMMAGARNFANGALGNFEPKIMGQLVQAGSGVPGSADQVSQDERQAITDFNTKHPGWGFATSMAGQIAGLGVMKGLLGASRVMALLGNPGTRLGAIRFATELGAINRLGGATGDAVSQAQQVIDPAQMVKDAAGGFLGSVVANRLAPGATPTTSGPPKWLDEMVRKLEGSALGKRSMFGAALRTVVGERTDNAHAQMLIDQLSKRAPEVSSAPPVGGAFDPVASAPPAGDPAQAMIAQLAQRAPASPAGPAVARGFDPVAGAPAAPEGASMLLDQLQARPTAPAPASPLASGTVDPVAVALSAATAKAAPGGESQIQQAIRVMQKDKMPPDIIKRTIALMRNGPEVPPASIASPPPVPAGPALPLGLVMPQLPQETRALIQAFQKEHPGQADQEIVAFLNAHGFNVQLPSIVRSVTDRHAPQARFDQWLGNSPTARSVIKKAIDAEGLPPAPPGVTYEPK